jgi:hypothetical protein
MMRVRIVFLVLAAGAVWAAIHLPLDHEAIQYRKGPANNDISRLENRLREGRLKLHFDEKFGYLPAVLEALDVPAESQMLVFSKTSFQASRINPVTPRAIYFNETVSVGFVPDGDVVELVVHDPRQGAIFYTLDQERAATPSFVRRDDACLQCHESGGTLDVPGLLIRSVYPEPSGMPLFQAGGFITDHRSPLEKRWGGWYVTGTHGEAGHMGNSFARNREQPDQLDTAGARNLMELPSRVRQERLLTPHSDLVALMVAEHQFQGLNLITRLNFETRLAVHSRAEMTKLLGRTSPETEASTRRRIARYGEELTRYLLFLEEPSLPSPVAGSSGFARKFAARGRLHELELKTRLFRAPISYLIDSPAIAALPAGAKADLRGRLEAVADGTLADGPFARVTPEARSQLREILQTVKW